ncbi:hypothetical protein [Mycobacterium sp. DL99]|uniref:hypothetical protein n=1 Tax=Mycobacterium sp. DL99 TaxID=2528957 RepID=UPI00108159B5|nr:hypothetical protein [Mycobacterium sp. DL99]
MTTKSAKAPKAPRWMNGAIEGKVTLSTGVAGVAFPSTWVQASGGKPPNPLVMGRSDGGGKRLVSASSIYQATQGEVEYAEKLPEAHGPIEIGIPVAADVYNKLSAAGDSQGFVKVKFKHACFWTRVRYVPGALGAFIGALATLMAAVVSGTVAVVSGLSKPSAPMWMYVAAFAVLMLVAMVGFIVNVRDRTKAPK